MTPLQQVYLLCFILFPLVTVLQSALLLWWSWPGLCNLARKRQRRSNRQSVPTLHTTGIRSTLAAEICQEHTFETVEMVEVDA